MQIAAYGRHGSAIARLPRVWTDPATRARFDSTDVNAIFASQYYPRRECFFARKVPKSFRLLLNWKSIISKETLIVRFAIHDTIVFCSAPAVPAGAASPE